MLSYTVKINTCCKIHENRNEIAAVTALQRLTNNGRHDVTKFEIRKNEKLLSLKCQGDHMFKVS